MKQLISGTAFLMPPGICLGGKFTTLAPSFNTISQTPALHKPVKYISTAQIST